MGDDGQVCCILGVCCPPGSGRQREALAMELDAAPVDAPGGLGERSTARRHADWILDNYDLAPKGSLTTLKDEVARLARRPK